MATKEKKPVPNNGTISVTDGMATVDIDGTTVTIEPTKPRIICICGFAGSEEELKHAAAERKKIKIQIREREAQLGNTEDPLDQAMIAWLKRKLQIHTIMEI